MKTYYKPLEKFEINPLWKHIQRRFVEFKAAICNINKRILILRGLKSSNCYYVYLVLSL